MNTERQRQKKNSVVRGVDTSLGSQFFGSSDFKYKGETENMPANELTYAMVTGHVIETELRTNEITGETFYWALIRTAGDMEVDVVIHPAVLERSYERPPKVGGIVQGYFWLSGLLLPDMESD